MEQIAQVESGIAEAEASRHDLTRAQKRLEDDISSFSDKASQHDKTLYSGTISNPRDLQALQDEITALRRRIGQLEDQDIDLMEQIEPIDGQLARLSAERTALDESASAIRARIAEEEVAIDAELASVRSERDAMAANVDETLLGEYESLRPKMGGIAIARLTGGSCGGCHLALSAVEVARLKKLPAEEPAWCDECGRLLAR